MVHMVIEKKSGKSLNIKLLLPKDGKRQLLVSVIESCEKLFLDCAKSQDYVTFY